MDISLDNMKIKYLDSYIEHITEPCISRLDSSGLYHFSDREEEDSGWNSLSHILYKKDNATKWRISYIGNTYNFYQETGGIILSPEEFLNFVKSETPDALDWLLFNIDILRGKNE